MRIYAYTTTTIILIGLLAWVAYMYIHAKIENSDSILMFIIAQVLGVWVGLTNKIFRIAQTAADNNLKTK